MATIPRTAPTHHRPAPPGAVRTTLRNLHRRHRYLIDPRTQFSITRQFLVVLLAASALSVGNYHVARVLFESQQFDAFGAAMSLGYCGVMLAISISLLFLLCVFFSHRIAGPVWKLSEALDAMAHGDLSVKVTLRDNDLLTELAGAVNAANRGLRGALSDVDREVRRARVLAAGNPELADCLGRAERALENFRLSTGKEVDPRAMVAASRPR